MGIKTYYVCDAKGNLLGAVEALTPADAEMIALMEWPWAGEVQLQQQ